MQLTDHGRGCARVNRLADLLSELFGLLPSSGEGVAGQHFKLCKILTIQRGDPRLFDLVGGDLAVCGQLLQRPRHIAYALRGAGIEVFADFCDCGARGLPSLRELVELGDQALGLFREIETAVPSLLLALR